MKQPLSLALTIILVAFFCTPAAGISAETELESLVRNRIIRHVDKEPRVDTVFQTAARVHARDMAERNYFAGRTPEGTGPVERLSSVADSYLGSARQFILEIPGTRRKQLINGVGERWGPGSALTRFLRDTKVRDLGIGVYPDREGQRFLLVALAGFRVKSLNNYRDTLQRHLRDDVNQFRHRHGLSPLSPDSLFERAAHRHARDMVRRNYFAHESPDGQSPMDRIEAIEPNAVRRILENLAYQTPEPPELTAESIVEGWANSPGHRQNMLTEGVRVGGVGLAGHTERNLIFVVHKFGNRTSTE